MAQVSPTQICTMIKISRLQIVRMDQMVRMANYRQSSPTRPFLFHAVKISGKVFSCINSIEMLPNKTAQLQFKFQVFDNRGRPWIVRSIV